MRMLHPRRDAPCVRTSHEAGARADGTPIIVDLFSPIGAAGPVPAVILPAGAPDGVNISPRAGRYFPDWAAACASAGAAAVLFDHAMGWPKCRLDQALGEFDRVLAWLGEVDRVDRARVMVMTVSGGALLVPQLLNDARPLRLAGAAMLYPVLGALGEGDAAIQADAESAARMDLRAAAARLAGADKRLLIVRAGADQYEGLNARLDETVAALLQADARLELINLPGAPHGFDHQIDTPETRAAIERVLAFATSGWITRM